MVKIDLRPDFYATFSGEYMKEFLYQSIQIVDKEIQNSPVEHEKENLFKIRNKLVKEISKLNETEKAKRPQ